MLREISSIRQNPDEPHKRWFSSASMDLVAWFDDDDVLVAFHLCYDKSYAERAVVWRRHGAGLEHLAVDDGESMPGKHKASPILTAGSRLPLSRVREKLLLESSELPPVILADVLARLDAGDRVMGVTRFGGYVTVIDSPQEYVYLIPPDWDDAQGAAFLAQTMTAWYALKTLGDIQPGHQVLIHSAAGGVGLQAMRLARAVGAEPVGSVGTAEKLPLLEAEGFTDVLVRERSFAAQLQRESRSFDLVLDAIGGDVQLASFAALKSMGRLVVFGAAEFTPSGSRPNYLSAAWKFLRRPRYDVLSMISENKSVLAFNLIWLWEQQERMHILLEELQQMELPPPHVGHRFPFSDAHRALDCLRSGKSTGKVVLEVS